MFSEILRIIPRLSPGDASKMEHSLSRRFGNVAKRFRGGLSAAIKGSILGISVGLLNRILNPIEALEEKINKILDDSKDLQELADRFNTTPGQLRKIQDLGQTVGVSPEKLNELMGKFAEAVENARDEIRNPFATRSDSTKVVKNFVNDSDLAESFLSFLTSLSKTEDPHQKRLQEKAVFGQQLFGAEKRFGDSNFPTAFKSLGGPDSNTINNAVDKTAGLDDLQRKIQVRNATNDLVSASSKLNERMIVAMEAANNREQAELNKRLGSYENLRRGADAVEDIKKVLSAILDSVTGAFALIKPFTEWFVKFDAKMTKLLGRIGG